jgi:hypothetical protein
MLMEAPFDSCTLNSYLLWPGMSEHVSRESNIRGLESPSTSSGHQIFALQKFGGADGSRTHDLLNAIQALSQLSYGPTHGRTEK